MGVDDGSLLPLFFILNNWGLLEKSLDSTASSLTPSVSCFQLPLPSLEKSCTLSENIPPK